MLLKRDTGIYCQKRNLRLVDLQDHTVPKYVEKYQECSTMCVLFFLPHVVDLVIGNERQEQEQEQEQGQVQAKIQTFINHRAVSLAFLHKTPVMSE